MDIPDIPKIKNRKERFAEIFVDCYNDDEWNESMRIYVTDNLEFPFDAVLTRDMKSKNAVLKKGAKVRVIGFEDDDEVRKLIVEVQCDDRTSYLPLNWFAAANKTTTAYVVIEDYKSFLETY